MLLMALIFMAHLACFLRAQDQQTRIDTIYSEAVPSYIKHQPPLPPQNVPQANLAW